MTIVDKKKLKISAEEHEKRLREDKVTAKMLEERDRQVEEAEEAARQLGEGE